MGSGGDSIMIDFANLEFLGTINFHIGLNSMSTESVLLSCTDATNHLDTSFGYYLLFWSILELSSRIGRHY